MNFGTKGCMYCEGECNKECLPKKETLEEATEKYARKWGWETALDFKEGAKWQAERMYSDLELFINEVKDKIDSFEYSVNQQSYLSEYITDWFEQFKKK